MRCILKLIKVHPVVPDSTVPCSAWRWMSVVMVVMCVLVRVFRNLDCGRSVLFATESHARSDLGLADYRRVRSISRSHG